MPNWLKVLMVCAPLMLFGALALGLRDDPKTPPPRSFGPLRSELMADGGHNYDLITPTDANDARGFLYRNNVNEFQGRPLESLTDRQVVALADSLKHLAVASGGNYTP